MVRTCRTRIWVNAKTTPRPPDATATMVQIWIDWAEAWIGTRSLTHRKTAAVRTEANPDQIQADRSGGAIYLRNPPKSPRNPSAASLRSLKNSLRSLKELRSSLITALRPEGFQLTTRSIVSSPSMLYLRPVLTVAPLSAQNQ